MSTNIKNIPQIDQELAGVVEEMAGDVGELKSALDEKLDIDDFHSILVQTNESNENDIGQVTVTNIINAAGYYDGSNPSDDSGLVKTSKQGGVVKWTGGNGSQLSPYINYINKFVKKMWIVGFK